MSNKNTLLKIVLPLLILLAGIAAAVALIKMQKPPQKQTPPERGLLVEVSQVESKSHQVRVYATGTVQPRQEISMIPEVSGKVVWLSPRLVTGGFLKKGEKLLEIDSRDYLLAVDSARAALAQAEVSLQTEQQQAQLALEEWQQLDLPDKGEPSSLVLREPQLQSAQATLDAARASLQQAELNLQRTILYAPFNCRVRSEQVDEGQYLKAGNSVATLAGTDQVEITVPLPLSELQWLDIPRAGQAGAGSQATVQMHAGETLYTWQGSISRAVGEVDSSSHMASIVVTVDDPYQRTSGTAESFALAVGMYVDIILHGRTLDKVVAIPREALREESSVWIADDDNKLRVRPVHIARRERDLLLIDAGLSGGERLIETTLDGAADGMALRPTEQESAQ